MMPLRMLTAAAVVLSLPLAGCSSLGLTAWPWSQPDPLEPVDRIVEVVALWQPGQGQDADGIPTRGFAGQLMFFGSDGVTPVAIDGDVSVYVFDDHGDTPGRPLHVFRFANGAMKKYVRPSAVGTTYQLFLPYTRKGSHHAVCSLRVKFEDGPYKVMSEAGEVVLAGKKTESHRQTAAVPPNLRQTVGIDRLERPDDLPTLDELRSDETREERIQRMLAELERSVSGTSGGVRQAGYETSAAATTMHATDRAVDRVADDTTMADTPRRSGTLKVYSIPLN